jgi:hypothetical protein
MKARDTTFCHSGAPASPAGKGPGVTIRVRPMTGVVTAVLVATLAVTGCATSKLWDEQSYHPADHPNPNLAFDPKSADLLVQYTEQCAETKSFRRRAYWLFASTNSIANHGRPVFVKARAYAGLIPVPLLEEPPATNAPTVAGYLAVATPAQQGFDLWRDGAPLGRYYLAIYFATPRPTVWRVVATPFAALGDVVVVVVVSAAVVAVVVGLLYLDSQTH